MNTVFDHTYGIYKAYPCNLDRHKWQLFLISPSKEGPLSSELKKKLFIPKTKKLKYLKIILATDSEKS